MKRKHRARRSTPTAEEQRTAAKLLVWQRVLEQACAEFGTRCRLDDIDTLLAVARSEPDWPKDVSLEAIQRLEAKNGRGRPGHDMVCEDPEEPWGLRLTPKGRRAVDRILEPIVAYLDAGPPAVDDADREA